MKKMMRRFAFASVAALGLAAAPAQALVLVETDSATESNGTTTVNQYSGSFGPLAEVRIHLTGYLEGSLGVENPSDFRDFFNAYGGLSVSLPLNSDVNLFTNVTVVFASFIAAFDGNIDFGGDSGRTFHFQDSDSDSGALNDAASLALFTGPGTIDLGTSPGVYFSIIEGNNMPHSSFSPATSVGVTVEYYVDRIVPLPAALPAGLGLLGLAAFRRRRNG